MSDFKPPLPRLTGLDNLFAAIHHEADFMLTKANEGEHWDRVKHADWLRICWLLIHFGDK